MCARSGPQHQGELFRLRSDAALDQLPILGQDVDLAVPLVDIDANMVHGGPSHSCGFDRVLLWGDSTPPR
jgi:hypothetical protein